MTFHRYPTFSCEDRHCVEESFSIREKYSFVKCEIFADKKKIAGESSTH